MARAKKGDRVKINFTGTLEDGTIFESTLEDMECGNEDCGSDDSDSDDCGCGCEAGPMELTIGEDEFFSQVEEALIGMAPGEKKKVTIPAEDAFGEYDEEQIFTIGRDQVPADVTPEVGEEFELTDDDDEIIEVTVVEVTDTELVLDANHPLAGEDLTYEFELVEIL